ncbi:MAG: PglZ domain-containing protein, partial [Bacteroidota bacterium]|nr:PglZ domain-containing protein [Bacteroidota bacterium]
MDIIKILWVDDEIELLKPHVMFLQSKGYGVDTLVSGDEALEELGKNNYDIVFLDENMPGLSGIETLMRIKNIQPNLPVVMITKSEEEIIMEDAIGANIADYLIKPVNPNQILLCLKKNLDHRKIKTEKKTHAYQQEFRNIGTEIDSDLSFKQWKEVYKKLVYWEIELDSVYDAGMLEVLKMQKAEANQVFSKFIEKNYRNWLNNKSDEKPLFSHTILRKKLFPVLQNTDKPVFLLLIDNLRFDQWKVLQPIIEQNYRIEEEDIFLSILPSVTQYARNALFSGMMPSEIVKKYPQYWTSENDEGTKNKYEEELLGEYLKRFGMRDVKYSYNKILSVNAGRKLSDNLSQLMDKDLNVIVYNFIDMLSHARTEMEIIRELADDESAYRSLTLSWFEHSPLKDIIDKLSEKDVKVIITTDHGSVKVDNPVKIVGDRSTNKNLRYKTGKNLNFNHKEAFDVRNPEELFLPK